jgi:hypothetical protein
MDTWNKKGVTESRNPLNFKVPPAGIEPATPGLGNSSGTIPSDPSENPDSSTGCNQKKN